MKNVELFNCWKFNDKEYWALNILRISIEWEALYSRFTLIIIGFGIAITINKKTNE